MSWRFDTGKAVFIQIAEKIKEDILCGKYAPNSQIPSVRQLAFDASVNPNTVQHALSSLESLGLIYTKGTTGRFVTGDAAVLDSMRSEMISSLVASFVKSAKTLGVSSEELIKYIKEVKPE